MKITSKFAMIVATVLFTVVSLAQDKKPASPSASAKGVINGANITIEYSSPSVKGRKIWGDLVPYGKLWRAGANAPTTIETDKALKIEGKELPAGKYAIYVIPEEGTATVIFGKDPKVGFNKYEESLDVLRVKIKTRKTTKLNESLVYSINKKEVVLSWEYLEFPLTVK